MALAANSRPLFTSSAVLVRAPVVVYSIALWRLSLSFGLWHDLLVFKCGKCLDPSTLPRMVVGSGVGE